MKTIKKILGIFILSISILSYSQSLEFGFGFGTGSNYIFENNDSTININYKTPSSIYTDLKYKQINSNVGILLRYQYTNTSVNGQKWFDQNQFFEAIINDNSLFLLIEYIKENENKINFGGNFGIGYSKQTIDFFKEERTLENTIPSLNLSSIIQYKFNKKLNLKFQPTLQLFDPINIIKKEQYNFAKEDLNFLLMLGLTYQL